MPRTETAESRIAAEEAASAFHKAISDSLEQIVFIHKELIEIKLSVNSIEREIRTIKRQMARSDPEQ